MTANHRGESKVPPVMLSAVRVCVAVALWDKTILPPPLKLTAPPTTAPIAGADIVICVELSTDTIYAPACTEGPVTFIPTSKALVEGMPATTGELNTKVPIVFALKAPLSADMT